MAQSAGDAIVHPYASLLGTADYEVIVVDDAASEETKQQVACWAERVKLSKHTLRYIPVTGVCHPHGPATARNIGWQAACGEVIAFTDDDCIPTPGWLRAGVAALIDDIAGAAGRTVVPLSSVPTDYEYNASHLQHAEFVTANCFYRRTALIMVGDFDERFTAPLGTFRVSFIFIKIIIILALSRYH